MKNEVTHNQKREQRYERSSLPNIVQDQGDSKGNKCFTDKNLYFFFLISIEGYLPSLFIGLSKDTGKFHLQPINSLWKFTLRSLSVFTWRYCLN